MHRLRRSCAPARARGGGGGQRDGRPLGALGDGRNRHRDRDSGRDRLGDVGGGGRERHRDNDSGRGRLGDVGAGGRERHRDGDSGRDRLGLVDRRGRGETLLADEAGGAAMPRRNSKTMLVRVADIYAEVSEVDREEGVEGGTYRRRQWPRQCTSDSRRRQCGTCS